MDVRHEHGRFFVITPNGDAEVSYKINNDKMIIYHTYTPHGERVKGIAEEITKIALEYAKEENLKIVPDCPYTKSFFNRHDEYRDLLG